MTCDVPAGRAMLEELRYYCTQSALTDPGSHAALLRESASNDGELMQWVRNVQFHEAYAREAKLDLPEEAIGNPRESDAAVRFLEETLRRIVERDPGPLRRARPKERCFIGTCRDYAVLLCALIRAQGRPARVRCGFAFYFEPQSGFGDDHWVTEVWDPSAERWILLDAEIDGHLPQHGMVSVDPLNVPREEFQVAGTAWRRARAGDANRYGVSSIGISGGVVYGGQRGA